MTLATETCTLPDSAARALTADESLDLIRQVPKWSLQNTEIVREFHFRDFRKAVNFINRVADIAEEQNHHPEILIMYNKVRLILSTFKIGRLSRNDFIVAAKIDELDDQGGLCS